MEHRVSDKTASGVRLGYFSGPGAESGSSESRCIVDGVQCISLHYQLVWLPCSDVSLHSST